MKRFNLLAVLMVLSSSAYAGDSLSFVVGGHRIHIEAPRSCRSPSCVSVSIPGIYETRRRRDRDDDDDLDDALEAPARPPAPASEPASLSPVVPLASKPAIALAASAPPPPAIVKPAVAAVQEIVARPSTFQPPRMSPMTPRIETPRVETATEAARPAPDAAPQLLKISHDVEDEPAATPLGDWQSQAKTGSVRIERCDRALCGYVLDPSSKAPGETVLINMTPKAASEWSGNIYSRDSGNTYYATIAMKGPNALRVEACALGHFFCSGNVWSRIGAQPEKLMTSRQVSPPPS